MRNLAWNIFQRTGSVDAYLLYRDLAVPQQTDGNDRPEEDEEDG
ncbi:YqzL family protein [Laceyella sacchari]|nr:YqzL family protein [Laceyella sacchari]